MSRTAAPARGIFGMTVIALAMMAVLVGLGVWQLQRRTEKHALIAALTERLAAAPVPLPQSSSWKTLSPAHDEFRRVSVTATFAREPDAMVYSSGSAVRPDILGPGTWAFLPARLADGSVVAVNAGFVQNTMQDRAQQDRAVSRLLTGTPVVLTGYLRFPEGAGLLTPREDTGKRLWFVRDPQAMARTLGWGEIAPFYIDLESPVPDSGIPKPGPLDVHLKDDHLQYAITWFGLATAVLAAFGFWLAGQRRARMQPH
ncbi:MAG: SURF1 family protein [Bradyrhizobiaceae bacterium]|nr:MAG: SURF1 family protein [Bradyrhizobiaceae bacterium]